MLTLHYHPLSSYCWKVLIALYENGTPFEAKRVDLGDADARAAFQRLWPTARIPLLDDDGRIVPETSIQIEYLDLHHPGATPLLPGDPASQLDVRLWDRLFDLYVMDPMQRFIGQQLRAEADRDPLAIDGTRAALIAAYALIESRIGERTWAAGDAFTMADCAAAPSLFYATIVEPLPPGHPRLDRYVERLLARPSVRRVIDEARPWFRYFPLHHAMPARFRDDAATRA